MKDYFLRAENRQMIDQALRAVGLLFYVDDEPILNAVVDYVGRIYRPTGVMLFDPEGGEYPEMQMVDGYHANLRADLTTEKEALLPIIEAPNNPQRIFAGGIL